jgi:hypothetical protein
MTNPNRCQRKKASPAAPGEAQSREETPKRAMVEPLPPSPIAR